MALRRMLLAGFPRRSRLKKRSPLLHRKRFLLSGIAVLAGLLTGAGVSHHWAVGLKPVQGAAITLDGGGVGEIELVRMPVGARALAEISTFIIDGGSGDDFDRIFVNNYLVANDEDSTNVFYLIGKSEAAQKRAAAINALTVERYNRMVGKKEVRPFLKSGWNYILVENENSVLGPCASSIDILVNGVRLEGFPKSFPADFYPEVSITNEALASLFDLAPHNTLYPELSPSSLHNALCARRIFALLLR